MIALALALMMPAPPTAEEIVVIAGKMRFINVDIKAPKRKGKLVLERCRIKTGTGNAEIDAIPCAVATDCMAAAPTSRRVLEACVEERSNTRLDEIFDRWRMMKESQP